MLFEKALKWLEKIFPKTLIIFMEVQQLQQQLSDETFSNQRHNISICSVSDKRDISTTTEITSNQILVMEKLFM